MTPTPILSLDIRMSLSDLRALEQFLSFAIKSPSLPLDITDLLPACTAIHGRLLNALAKVTDYNRSCQQLLN